jgi:hypothetical protein
MTTNAQEFTKQMTDKMLQLTANMGADELAEHEENTRLEMERVQNMLGQDDLPKEQ